jgi:hypothetical protein
MATSSILDGKNSQERNIIAFSVFNGGDPDHPEVGERERLLTSEKGKGFSPGIHDFL